MARKNNNSMTAGILDELKNNIANDETVDVKIVEKKKSRSKRSFMLSDDANDALQVLKLIYQDKDLSALVEEAIISLLQSNKSKLEEVKNKLDKFNI